MTRSRWAAPTAPALLTRMSIGPSSRSTLRERVVDRGAVADVGVQRQARADRRDRLPGGVQPDVERRDARAVGGEAVTDRLADARAAARDHGDPAVEAHAGSGTATRRPRPPPAASRS